MYMFMYIKKKYIYIYLYICIYMHIDTHILGLQLNLGVCCIMFIKRTGCPPQSGCKLTKPLSTW